MTRAAAGAALSGMLAVTGLALAGGNDEAAEEIVDSALSIELAAGRSDAALEALGVAQAACEGHACTTATRAKIAVGFGVVHAERSDADAARRSFAKALQLDPDAKLPAEATQKKAVRAMHDAQRLIAAEREAGCMGRFEAKRHPRGAADFCRRQADLSLRRGDAAACISDARASLSGAERNDTRWLLGRCLEADNQWQEAAATYAEVAERAHARRRFRRAKEAKKRAMALMRKLPSLRVEAPEGVRELVMELDGTKLDVTTLDAPLVLDPGPHVITAKGRVGGSRQSYRKTFELAPSEERIIEPSLTVDLPEWIGGREQRCMDRSPTADAFRKCIALEVPSDVSVTVTSEVSGYHDDMHVDVVSPAIGANVEHVTAGWGLGATFVIDVVTAASVDILATASPRWREIRYAPALNGHVRFGDVDIGAHGSLSHEPDYIATGVGADVSIDLANKNVTPSLGYEFSYDIVGKSDTPFEVFSRRIHRHAATAGLTLVLGKATLATASGLLVFENGDSSKPYRYVSMFGSGAQVWNGMSIADVNAARHPVRALEQLPGERQRYALSLSIAHRFDRATLRGSERVYGDSWGVVASTTDLLFLYDVTDWLRLWPHARFHVQRGADFWQLAYGVQGDGSSITLPRHRTGDRELGPLHSITGGAGVRLRVNEQPDWGVTLVGDAIYTSFDNHLFATQRIGAFGALGVEGQL